MGSVRIPFEPEKYYHVYNHGNGNDNIFRNDDNYYYFLRKYGEYLSPILDTYAYCLMPNHFHFLVRIKSEEELLKTVKRQPPQGLEALAGVGKPTEVNNINLSKIVSQHFSNFLNGYTQAFNKQYERKGSLFLDNIRRKTVETEYYFTQLIFYIHNNPVHHGFTKDLADWKFSSYWAFLLNKETKLQKEQVLGWFGGQNDYKNFHKQGADKIVIPIDFE
jgi:putative transposase